MIARARAYLFTPASPRPLAWFRIAVAIFFLVRLWSVRTALVSLYGEAGWVGWAVTRHEFPGVVHISSLAAWLSPLGLSASGTVYAVCSLHAVALIGLLLGCWTRTAAIAAWVTNLMLIHARAGTLYGADYFAHVALSYCVIMPVGDALALGRKPGHAAGRPSVAAGLTRRLLQFQLCIVYTISGLEKARGPEWWNGEAIWRVLCMPSLSQLDMNWLAFQPWLPMLAGWAVMLIECGYAAGLGWAKTRRIWLLLVVLLHGGIGLGLGMPAFGAIMIILSLTAFGAEAIGASRPVAATSAPCRR